MGFVLHNPPWWSCQAWEQHHFQDRVWCRYTQTGPPTLTANIHGRDAESVNPQCQSFSQLVLGIRGGSHRRTASSSNYTVAPVWTHIPRTSPVGWCNLSPACLKFLFHPLPDRDLMRLGPTQPCWRLWMKLQRFRQTLLSSTLSRDQAPQCLLFFWGGGLY